MLNCEKGSELACSMAKPCCTAKLLVARCRRQRLSLQPAELPGMRQLLRRGLTACSRDVLCLLDILACKKAAT
jgi:hypothetical protein